MAYVAVKGGASAIENALRYAEHERIKGSSPPLGVAQIADQLYLAVDRVMSEGSLYAPELAALAVKQSAGDLFEAAFIIRAYRATRSRLGYSIPRATGNIRMIRRISAAFKDIPGGQILGPTPDYSLRLLDFTLMHETKSQRKASLKKLVEEAGLPPGNTQLDTLPRVVDLLREEGLLLEPDITQESRIRDITRDSLEFPASRSAVLQSMARGESGGMLLLAYSDMRGFGSVHPTIGELRVGYLPVDIARPGSGETCRVGEIKVTEAEILTRYDNHSQPKFALGYGICFGHNEVKAISMAVLDQCMQAREKKAPAEDQEFVLQHIDGIESMGFCNHFKLPHYVTFQSVLDRVRHTRAIATSGREMPKEEST